jgi:hypothetical protein
MAQWSTKRRILGVFLLLGIAVTWVAATQFAQSAAVEFEALFASMYFSTCWIVLLLPLHYGVHTLIARWKRDTTLPFWQNVSLTKRHA